MGRQWMFLLGIWIVLILLLGMGMGLPLFALDPAKKLSQYRLQVWNSEAGLPGDTVFAVLQTRDGYLWVGTQSGLARFDGLDFHIFTQDNTNLPGNDIRALYQDQQGTLWIGTYFGGLARYRAGEFFSYPATSHPALQNIRALQGDDAGNLWIGSFTRGQHLPDSLSLEILPR